MHYPNIRPAVFLRRENRFTAALRLPTGEEIAAHVRTTGRCAELFRPGVPAWVQYAPSPARKTAYTLITVEKAPGFLSMWIRWPRTACLPRRSPPGPSPCRRSARCSPSARR